jgi:hypothetical protein
MLILMRKKRAQGWRPSPSPRNNFRNATTPSLHQQQRVLNIERAPLVAYRQHHLRKTESHRLLAKLANMLLAIELLFAFLLPLVAALKFDIQAHPGHESASKERCIRNFVAKDQLVVVTATVSGSRGDGQTLNMHVSWLRFGKNLWTGSRQLG